MIACCQESYDKPGQYVKKERHHFADQGPYSQDYSLSTSHIWLWKVDHKEGRAPKNWCFWTVVLEKTLESPWTARRSNQSILKEISPEYSLDGLMLKLQSFSHLMWTADSLEKPLMQERSKSEKKATEDEMVGWYHWFNGHEIGQVPGDNEGQGSLVCCSPWSCKESDMTRQLKNNW